MGLDRNSFVGHHLDAYDNEWGPQVVKGRYVLRLSASEMKAVRYGLMVTLDKLHQNYVFVRSKVEETYGKDRRVWRKHYRQVCRELNKFRKSIDKIEEAANARN